jgi:hypothetical protein
MPAMTVDQTTGYLYILFYDQRNFADEGSTDVCLAVSKNGGLKFEKYKVNDKTFKPNKEESFGNYIGISAVNNSVRPIWMQRDKKKELNVYTAIIDAESLQKYKEPLEIEMGKSFKFAEEIKIPFSLKNAGEVSAVITKPLDANFEKIIFKSKKLKAGNNSLLIKSKELGLTKGSYVLTLYSNNSSIITWITEE